MQNVKVITQQAYATNEQGNKAIINSMVTNTVTSIDTYPNIDYKRPLMTCIETLTHNDKMCVKKPAGILNTIAVPLMTYSSSLEHGTVFAAAEPFDTPLASNFEVVNHECKTSKKSMYTNTKVTSNTILHNFDVTFRPTTGTTVYQYKGAKKKNQMNTDDVTLRPNTETMVNLYKTYKKYTNTKATKGTLEPRIGTIEPKTTKDSTHTNALRIQNTKIMKHNYKDTKTYTNTKATQDSTHTNAIRANTVHSYKATKKYTNTKANLRSVPTANSMDQGYKTDSTPRKAFVSIGPKTLIVGRGHKATSNLSHASEQFNDTTKSSHRNSLTVSIVSNTLITGRKLNATTDYIHTDNIDGSIRPNNGTIEQGFKATTDTTCTINFLNATLSPSTQTLKHRHKATTVSMYKKIDDSLIPSTGYTNTSDLSFVPYTEHVATVTPDSLDAHVAGGTLDYGLPLLNCIGTVLQGTIHYTTKSEETSIHNATIDVPLMKCFKTLEDSEVL